MAPTVSLDHGNSAQVLELCQKRLATQDPSLQSAVRFSALATAFLSSNTGSQTYGSVAVSGGERFVRKVPLLYFLLRAAEKNNAQALGRDSRGRVRCEREYQAVTDCCNCSHDGVCGTVYSSTLSPLLFFLN